jgi:hypothetical protein
LWKYCGGRALRHVNYTFCQTSPEDTL